MRKLFATYVLVLFAALAFFTPARVCASTNPPQTNDVRPIEIFPILELPLSVHEALLVNSDKGYLLKLSLANSSDMKMIGVRYSLVTIDSENRVQFKVNRTEGFQISPYAKKSLTFKTPIKMKATGGERLVLMLEQVVSRESIWEVLKAKELFEAYARGDYSVRPMVLRVANHVDVPPFPSPVRY